MALSGTPIVDVDAFTATVQKPDVGTDIDAEDVEAVAQALANRTKNLNTRLTVTEAKLGYIGSDTTSFDNDASTAEHYTGATFGGGLTTANVSFASLVAGDYVVIRASGTMQLVGAAGAGTDNGQLRIHLVEDTGGAAAAFNIAGARVVLDQPGQFPFSLTAFKQISNPGTCQARIEGCIKGATFTDLYITKTLTLRIEAYRLMSVPL